MAIIAKQPSVRSEDLNVACRLYMASVAKAHFTFQRPEFSASFIYGQCSETPSLSYEELNLVGQYTWPL